MATTIRLTRMGRKKRPFYRLVVLDNRKRRDGAYLANLGYYNPFTEPHQVELHADEIMSWLSKGATMSETARSLLRSEGVLYRYSLAQQGLDAAQIETKMAAWAQDAENRKQGELNAAAARKEAERKARDEREAAAEAEKAAAAAAVEAEAAAAKAAAEAEAAAAAAAEAGEAAAEEAAAEAPAEVEAAPEAAETEENAEGDK